MLSLFFLTRPFIVLLHEMGHAIPALLLTPHAVTVYIGSYGDPHRSWQFRLGRLTIWFRLSLFWKTGLCVIPQQDMASWRRALFVLGGPVTSAIIAGVGCYFIFNYNLHGALKLFIVAFTLVALFDLLLNLIPNTQSIRLNNGKTTYNDGQSLKILWYYRKFEAEYEMAVHHHNHQEYRQAAILFERFIAYNLLSPEIYECAIFSLVNLHEYEAALKTYQDYAASYTPSAQYYGIGGWLKAITGFPLDALVEYDMALELNPDNPIHLNNKGYTLNLLGRYPEAVQLFNKAIELQPEFAYPYSNRGLSRIKAGEVAQGLADINRSLELDPSESYGHRNLGIYYLEQNDISEAQKHFNRAHELNPRTHLLPELLAFTAQFNNYSGFVNGLPF